MKFVAFCFKFSGDSYVEFKDKTVSKEFFRNFVQTKAILYQILWNFALLSAILFWIQIALNKFTQVLSYDVFTQVRRHVHKRIRKRRYGEETPGCFIFGKTVLFTLGLGYTTPYSSGILVLNFYHTFVTVSIHFWLRFEPQIRPTRSTINFPFIVARAKRKVLLCVKLFDFFRGWILIRMTWNLSLLVPNSMYIFTWNFRKKLFRKIFSKILCKPRLSSTKTCWISPYFLQFYYGSVLR